MQQMISTNVCLEQLHKTKSNFKMVKLPPATFPMEATYSMNASKAGNGDFPIKYVAEALVNPFDVNSWGL